MDYRVIAVGARAKFRLWVQFADGIEGEADLSDIAGRGAARVAMAPPLRNAVLLGGTRPWQDPIMTIEQVESEALKLTQPERARLAQRLIASLDEDGDIERAWYDEAARRLAELESGDGVEVSADEVFESLGLGVNR